MQIRTISDYKEISSTLRKNSPLSGRYAPSPSGPLHLGNVRTALCCWLQAKLAGGRLVMRMEDLDTPRVVQGCAETMLDELRWLGLDWDEGPDIGGPVGPYNQSQRLEIYQSVLEGLKQRELVYECYCSRKDIANAVRAPHMHELKNVYPGTCRELGLTQRVAKRKVRAPAWRFRVPRTQIQLEDEIQGRTVQDLYHEAGDFVVQRADGVFSYQFTVVVDDWLMGISDVMRGCDLLDSTPRQISLYQALDADPPRFWHIPLMLDEHGKRMAKRDGSMSLQQLKADGWRPDEVVGMLASSLGAVPPDTALSVHSLLRQLDQAALRRILIDGGKDA